MLTRSGCENHARRHAPASRKLTGPAHEDSPSERVKYPYPMARSPDTRQGEIPPRGHLLALDGVRGFAILVVMCSHAFESNYIAQGILVRFIGLAFFYGYLGVDLFFVLSGFLITGILYDSLQDSGYFRKFYARRALRIFPLYYGVLLVCYLLTRPLHLHWGTMGWLLPLYLQNLEPRTIMTYSPGGGIGLFHFWSLAIEEQFYLVWPAVVFLLRSRRALLRTTLGASAVALLLRLLYIAHNGSGYVIHVTTLFRADSLLLGGTLALLYRSTIWAKVQRSGRMVFLASVGLFVASSVFLEPRLIYGNLLQLTLLTAGVYPTLCGLGFCGLIAWSLQPQTWCQRLFQSGGLRFLGKYSYGIYVLHVFAVLLLVEPLRNAIDNATHSKLLSVAGAGIIALTIAVIAAYISYHLYERPFLRFKHHFDYAKPSLNQGAPEDAPAA
jgi:peptidoglycan/LPS O-acetylase OafA/YrhL